MTTPTILAQLDRLERDIRYHTPPDDGRPPFIYVAGSRPVLVSAPHGASHRRENHYKEEDEYTAALARLLGQRTGAHVLYAWALSDSDPNWDRESPYKDALRRIVREQAVGFVVDLHGMSNRHKFGIAVGTIDGRSCPSEEALILDTLEGQGFRAATAREARGFDELQWDRYVLNHGRFTGGLTSHTVTRFAAEELRIAAAQFELCSSLRVVHRQSSVRQPANFAGDAAAIAHTVATFETLIHRLAESVSSTIGV